MEQSFERLLNISTSGNQKNFNEFIHYNRYEPTSYYVLEALLHNYPLLESDNVVDFGSGKGRLNFFLNHFFKCRVTGEKSEDERVYPGISEKNTQSENGKTEAILRESRNARRNAEVECRNSADDRRIVRNAETQSVFTAEQRRLEEQKRLDEKERARAARKRNKRRSGPEL